MNWILSNEWFSRFRKFQGIFANLEKFCKSPIHIVFHSPKTFAKFRQNIINIHEHWSSNGKTYSEVKILLNQWHINLFENSILKFDFEKTTQLVASLLTFWCLCGAKVCTSCRYRQALSNEHALANIGFDTAENNPLKIWRWFNSFFLFPP